MQDLNHTEIIEMHKDRGFNFKTCNYSITGNYSSKDSLFNHKDVPHFNFLHPNLAYGFGTEGVYYKDTGIWIRFFKFLGFTFPILTLIKDDKKNSVLETFSFFCFYFLKVNTEKDLSNNKCKSTITYFIGCKNKILLLIFFPFFKKMFKKSFEDYKNDDFPFLNRRGYLRKNNFEFERDDKKFNFGDTLNLEKQRCFFTNKKVKNISLKIELNKIKNNHMNRFGDIGILGFQIFRRDNFLHIYHRVCPHEGGDLDINNNVGIPYTMKDFLNNKCRVRCNVHNRLFKPIVSINLNNDQKKFSSQAFDFLISQNFLKITIKKNKHNNVDWTS